MISRTAVRPFLPCLTLVLLLAAASCSTERKVASNASATPGASATATVASHTVTLDVGGMVCEQCVAKVHDQLAAVPGVSRVDVNLKAQRAQVVYAGDVPDSALTAAVRRAGPDFVGIMTR